MEYTLLSKLYYQDKLAYEQAYQARFNSDYAVKLEFDINGNRAFFLQTPDIYAMLSDILRINKAVSNLTNVLPPIALRQFSTRCLVDEIVLTNSIEGVRSTRKEISEILDELASKNKGKRFYGLVQKYKMLMTKEELPLNKCSDIRDIYDELVLAEVRAEEAENIPDGKWFRKGTVSVYSPSQKEIHKGLYPEEKIITALENALRFLQDDSCDILFRISIFHYLLEYIHPFYDGNGRLGRFICSYLLSRELESVTGYRLSYTIKEHITDYYQAFNLCNNPLNRGDLTPFLTMFLGIVQESIQKLMESLKEGLVLWNRHRNTIVNQKINDSSDPKSFQLYDLLIQAALFSEHGVDTSKVLQHLEISRGTLTAKLKKIPANLLIKTKLGNTNHYSLNLEQLDRLYAKPPRTAQEHSEKSL